MVLGDEIRGGTRAGARTPGRPCPHGAGGGRKLAIISGGEAGVAFRDVANPGKGGPNQEYALALMLALRRHQASPRSPRDTDGIDGGSGAATDPAGAFVLPDSFARAEALGLDTWGALDRHDSGGFFAALDDLVVTGPSYTNVNDFRVILVDNPPPDKESPP